MDERPRLSQPQCAQDWEDRKDVIMELYGSKTLKETMRIMEVEHLFKATEKQYKTQLQKWDIDHKRIKPTEYKAMIRKKRQREEDGQKESKFELRGLEVDDAKIIRFQKRHRISEPGQVFDCPTPPDLTCTTPAAVSLPPSPVLRPFPWYNTYERYLDLSMAGPSTTQFNDLRSIIHSLIVPFDNYEAECRHVPELCLKSHFASVVVEFLTPRTRAFCKNEPCQMCSLQGLLMIVTGYLLHISATSSSILSSLKARGTYFVIFWAVSTASAIRRSGGLRDEAIRLLETTILLVEPEVDLENVNTWYHYNEILIELAHFRAEDGHHDEARDLLENKIKFPSTLRFCSRYSEVFVGRLRRMLRRNWEEALQYIGELENGHGATRLRRERHTRVREGSSQPEASEWGPFLTESMEWDEI